MTDALANQAKMIRLPVHIARAMNRVLRTSHCLLQELGREPTAVEIGENVGMSAQQVSALLQYNQEPMSLEMLGSSEDDVHLVDFIEDPMAMAPADVANYRMLQEQSVVALKSLTDRERRIIELRFGLDGGHSRTREEVSKEFHVTGERIRQLEAKALKKLRLPIFTNSLSPLT
jgi:RNA polymerase primary sigma factor